MKRWQLEQINHFPPARYLLHQMDRIDEIRRELTELKAKEAVLEDTIWCAKESIRLFGESGK